MPTSTERVRGYGLARPGFTEARASLDRILRLDTDATWSALLTAAHVSPPPNDNDQPAFARLLTTFVSSDIPVIRLCGQALTIRLETYDHLAAVHDTIHTSD